jgi:hypothetical protein
VIGSNPIFSTILKAASKAAFLLLKGVLNLAFLCILIAFVPEMSA